MGKPLSGASIVLGLVVAGAAHAAPAGGGAFAFTGARLGMTLESWRALPFPGQPDPHVQAVCSGDPGAGQIPAIRPTAAERRSGARICSYALRYGPDLLPQGLRPAAGRQPAPVSYVFTGGRLSRIRYIASRDAFDLVTQRLKASYGPPRAVLRDTVQTEIGKLDRVHMSWTAPAGTAVLTDPADAKLDLAVELSAGPR